MKRFLVLRAAVCLALCLLAALSGLARAADYPNIVQQGFSRDAHYHLLLTSWIQDGSGFPAAALQITDVKRNTVAYRRQQVWKRDDVSAAKLSSLVGTWRSGQRSVLKRYGLTAPLAGQRLFKLAPLPMLAYPSAAPVSTLTGAGTFTLTSLPLKSGCRFSDRPTRGLALTLGGRELQRDSRLPASRACVSGYRLETAYRYTSSTGKAGLAVILRAFSQGFEGPDVLPLVVTAELK